MSVREQFAENPKGLPALRGVPAGLVGAMQFAPPNDRLAAANDNRRSLGSAVVKRASDLVFTVLLLWVLFPILLLIALIVKLDSNGAVIFRQTRLGRDAKPFDIFKFRTMHVVENGETVVQAQKNDWRVTRSGKWLRSMSLDELPQLFNVLRGEMSLVGPRPHAVAHDFYYATAIADYVLRQSVKPGITGWAQIHGLRGETPNIETMRARIDHDIWYANNATLATDLEILLRTPLAILRARNAH